MYLLVVLLVLLWLISVGRWLVELVVLIIELVEAPVRMETESVDPTGGGGEEGAPVRGRGG